MVDEFPGNSHRDKEQRTTPTSSPKKHAETKKVERITSGEVIRRKKPLGARFKAIFFNGAAIREVMGYVGVEVIVPRVKDMIADGAMEAVERTIFGESRPRRTGGWRPTTSGPSHYNGYFRPSGSSTPPWRKEQEPPRQMSRRGRAMHDFDEIVLESRAEAEQVLDTLYDMISQYNQATVADLYEMVGITSDYTNHKYGWTSLQGSNVQHVRGGGYLLNLPKPETLD